MTSQKSEACPSVFPDFKFVCILYYFNNHRTANMFTNAYEQLVQVNTKINFSRLQKT